MSRSRLPCQALARSPYFPCNSLRTSVALSLAAVLDNSRSFRLKERRHGLPPCLLNRLLLLSYPALTWTAPLCGLLNMHRSCRVPEFSPPRPWYPPKRRYTFPPLIFPIKAKVCRIVLLGLLCVPLGCGSSDPPSISPLGVSRLLWAFSSPLLYCFFKLAFALPILLFFQVCGCA